MLLLYVILEMFFLEVEEVQAMHFVSNSAVKTSTPVFKTGRTVEEETQASLDLLSGTQPTIPPRSSCPGETG